MCQARRWCCPLPSHRSVRVHVESLVKFRLHLKSIAIRVLLQDPDVDRLAQSFALGLASLLIRDLHIRVGGSAALGIGVLVSMGAEGPALGALPLLTMLLAV